MELFAPTDGAAASTDSNTGAQLLQAHGLSATLLVLAALVVLGATWQSRGLLGLRRPKDLRWLLALPAAIGCAFLGGSWALDPGVALAQFSAWHIALIVLYPVACELMFRGAIYGMILDLWAGHRQRWYGSARNLSALIYGVLTPLPLLMTLEPGFTLSGTAGTGLLVLAALAFGFTLGWVREESESPLGTDAGCTWWRQPAYCSSSNAGL